MAKGYTLEELQAMGAKPIGGTVVKKSYSLEELQALGAKPVGRAKREVVPAPQPVKDDRGLLAKTGSVVKNLGIGVAKGIGSTIAGASQLGEKGLGLIDKALGMEGRGLAKDPSLAGQVKASGALTPEGTAQKLGFGAEQIGEVLLPSGAVGKVARGAEVALGLQKAVKGAKVSTELAKGLGRVATRGVVEGGVALGQTAIQQGGVTPEAKAAGVIGAILPAGFSAVGKAVGGAGRLASEALGRSTGAGSAAIREVFERPEVIGFARKGTDAITDLTDQALEGAQKGLTRLTEKRGQAYVKELTKIKANKEPMMEIVGDAIMRADEALAEASVKFKKGAVLPSNAFRDSSIEQGKNAVTKAYRTLKLWRDYTPAGLDSLKKKLNQFKRSVANTTDGSYSVIKKMSDRVDDGLKTYVPNYRKMTSQYAEASDFLDEVKSALSLRDTNAKDTAIRKLMSALRQNNEMRLEFLRTLGKEAGQDVVGKITGATLAPLQPRGIAGGTSTLGTIGSFSVGSIPGLLLYLSASSPRLVGEAVALAGQIRKAADKNGNIPIYLRKALTDLLRRAAENEETAQ